MSHQPATTAPPECVTGCGHDGVVRVIDRGGAVDMCLLDVQALLGTCEGRMALVIDDDLDAAPGPHMGCCIHCGLQLGHTPDCPVRARAAAEPWERDGDRTDGSGPDLPDWPEEKENLT